MKELKERFPDGRGLRHRLRHDPVHHRVGQRGVQDPARRGDPGRVRGAVVPAKLAVGADPLVAVPVAIVGTFAVMAALGFSLNNLTLFGLVLAIGIVVDDAIVVVEAVEHHIEHGLAPREATIMAMSQVSAPVIAVGLVLTAVFVPVRFITGITGQFYRQFALTIATSTVISAFNSLTLEPGAVGPAAAAASQKGCSRRCPGRLSWQWAAGRATRSWARNCSSRSQSYGLQLDSTWVSLELAANLIGMTIGALAGYVVSGVLNRVFGWTLLPVQQGV